MATLTLTIPDAMLQRVINALCASARLTGPDVTAANAKAQVANYIAETTPRIRCYPCR